MVRNLVDKFQIPADLLIKDYKLNRGKLLSADETELPKSLNV
jgi:hypothetical protein